LFYISDTIYQIEFLFVAGTVTWNRSWRALGCWNQLH